MSTLLQGIEVGKQWGDIGVLIDGNLALARAKHAQGNISEALEALKQAEILAVQSEIPHWFATTVALRMRFSIAQDDIEAASLWARTYYLSDEMIQSYLWQFVVTTVTYISILDGDAGKVFALLPRLHTAALAAQRHGMLIEITALEALAYQVVDKMDQALKALDDALSLAKGEDYHRVFVELGSSMMRLLQVYVQASTSSSLAYANKILQTVRGANIVSLHTTLPIQQLEVSLIEPLSIRELEVLHQLVDGRSNQEIAEGLVIALSTVKWHLNNVYGKLNVRNRTQAIAKARKIHLFSD